MGIAYCHDRLQNAADAAVFRRLPAENGTRIGCAPSRPDPGVFEKRRRLERFSIDFTDFIDGSYYGLQVFLNTQPETGFARVLGVDSICGKQAASSENQPVR